MRYSFREGTRATKVKAEIVGAEIEAVAHDNDGLVTPKALVERARPQRAVLHECFEWDNGVAGELWRETQARELIRALVVVTDESKPTEATIGFVNVVLSDDRKGYVTTARLLSDDDLREQALSDALELLHGVKRRYAQLNELAEVFAAIDRVPRKTKRPKQGKRAA